MKPFAHSFLSPLVASASNAVAPSLVHGAPKMTSATYLTMNRHHAHEKVRSCVSLEKVEALISPRTSA
ncbi:MAG: hypothetical protein WBE29_13635, partial [Pseudolabrys sp.]